VIVERKEIRAGREENIDLKQGFG